MKTFRHGGLIYQHYPYIIYMYEVMVHHFIYIYIYINFAIIYIGYLFLFLQCSRLMPGGRKTIGVRP